MYDACMIYLILGQLVALAMCPAAERIGTRGWSWPTYVSWMVWIPLTWLFYLVKGYAAERSNRNRQA